MAEKKIQVVFIAPCPWSGGAEKVVYDLAHALNRQHFAPQVVFFRKDGTPPIPYRSDIPLFFVGGGNANLGNGGSRGSGIAGKLHGIYERLFSPAVRAKLRPAERFAYIRRQLQPVPLDTVVQAFGDLRGTLPALEQELSRFDANAVYIAVMDDAVVHLWLSQAHQRRRWIAWLHTVESHYLPLMHLREGRLAVEKWLLANASRNAEMVVVPSEGCKADLCDHFNIPAEHIRVIPNPLNIETIIRQSQEPPSMELPQKRTLFVQVGRFSQEKNHRLLVEACRLLRQEQEDFTVICLGEGPLRVEIKALVDEYGLSEYILLPGAVANPYPFMAAARAAILTSDFESFALVLAEAMACGAVPVSVDCPVGPRDVLNDGEYGLLTPPGDPQALADAMLKVACDDDLHARLIASGLARARRYDIDSITRQWETLLSL